MTEQMVDSRTEQTRRRRVGWREIGVVSAAAAFCAALTWTVEGPIGGAPLEVRDVGGGSHEVGLVSVIVGAVVAAAAGGALLRWWQRRSASATRNWTIVAVVVAVASMVSPTSALTLSDTMALISMHAVVAAVVIVGLRRASRAC